MCQKWEGDCGLWVLNEIIKKIYTESLKKIVGAIWELPGWIGCAISLTTPKQLPPRCTILLHLVLITTIVDYQQDFIKRIHLYEKLSKINDESLPFLIRIHDDSGIFSKKF